MFLLFGTKVPLSRLFVLHSKNEFPNDYFTSTKQLNISRIPLCLNLDSSQSVANKKRGGKVEDLLISAQISFRHEVAAQKNIIKSKSDICSDT